MGLISQIFARKRPNTELHTELAACLPVIELLCHQLQGIAAETEGKVLETCTSLSGVVSKTQEVVQTATNCIGGNDGNMGGEDLINATRTVLTSLLSVTESLCEVGEMSEAAKIVALNGRIEAARAGRYGDAFSVVARETGVLADKAKSTSSVVHDTVRELEMVLHANSQEGTSGHPKRCNELIGEILEQLEIHNTTVSHGLAELTAASQEIGSEVTRSIIALQFQDSVNQRIEHVITALRDISSTLEPFVAAADPDAVEARTQQWKDQLAKDHTMNSERRLLGCEGADDDGLGDIELF